MSDSSDTATTPQEARQEARQETRQEAGQDAAPAGTGRARPAGTPVDTADMADIGRVMVARAKDGDVQAAEFARKTWGWPQPVRLDLPPVTGAASLAAAHAVVIATAAAGAMTTRQALDFSTMLEYRRRAVETFEIEAKVEELYAAKHKTGGEQ
jgi:hypothetical protein